MSGSSRGGGEGERRAARTTATHGFPTRAPRFPPDELRSAFRRYLDVKAECTRTRDWTAFAALFTDHAHYVEHAYGEMFGRDEIERYIKDVMEPFPGMSFEEAWVAFDDERGAVVWEVQNVFPEPVDADTGLAFAFPNLSRLVYAGNGKFSEEQDWYNPSGGLRFCAGPTTRAWRRAGGKFASAEKLVMMHDKKKQAKL